MAEHTATSVLLLSVLIFLFFKYCVGDLAAEADNALQLDEPHTLPGSKCPVGTEYSAVRANCKPLVMSSKSLSERMLLLMPYFLRGISDSTH